jgi:hypothetical protein
MKRRDVIFTILGIVIICYLGFCFKASRRAKSISCTFNISAICLGTTFWADENNQGKQPSSIADLISCSNEISATRVLICPGDRFKTPATDFASLTTDNLSYELTTPAISTHDTNNAFLRCKVHGHLGYAWGIVFDGKNKIIPALDLHDK